MKILPRLLSKAVKKRVFLKNNARRFLLGVAVSFIKGEKMFSCKMRAPLNIKQQTLCYYSQNVKVRLGVKVGGKDFGRGRFYYNNPVINQVICKDFWEVDKLL